MPKMKLTKAGNGEAIAEVLKVIGFDPVRYVSGMVSEEIPMPKKREKGNYYDWEPAPGGQTLRLRASLRSQIGLKLAEFTHAKVKGEGGGSGPIGISVTVNSFAEDGKGEKVVMVPCGAKKVQPGGTNGVIDVPTVEVREV